MKNKKKLTKKILIEDYTNESFEWMTKEYGCAEFVLCPIIRRGKIREVHMYPAQQPNAKHFYVIKNSYGWEGVHFGTLLVQENGKDKVNQPTVWTTHYCKEHKTHSFSFYVPRGAKSFSISNGLGKFCLNWE